MTTQVAFGDYTILKPLGEGTFGTVFLAEHRFLKKKYVLKTIPKEIAEEEDFLHRFEEDVALLATLNHPHIAKVHNVSSAEGKYFIVMDAIVGSEDRVLPLRTFLEKEKPLKEETVVKIANQIASAIDYAHEKKLHKTPLIHRGIKWSNILIGPTPTLHLYLTDFALSHIAAETRVRNKIFAALSSRIAYGQDQQKWQQSFADSYPFLAPEQKVADGKITPAADVYAFGVLIYAILMGEYPEGFFELPSARLSNFKLNWDLFLFKTLQPDPAKRPTSLKGALEDLLAPHDKHSKITHWKQPSDEVKALPVEEKKESGPTPKPVLNPQEIKKPEYDPDPASIFKVDTEVRTYQPKENEEGKIEPILTEMVVIEGGTFKRGSAKGGRDEIPRHSIMLRSFAIDIHPVTNEQFVRFLDEMGGEKDSNNNDMIRLRDSRIKRSAGRILIESGYTKHPVVGVTWYGADAYAKWVGKRLPTEAEWEIAASGGYDDCIYPTGETLERSQANFFSADTTAVMSYPPNMNDLYDMAGNVYEWCSDWYEYHYYDVSVQEPDNPAGPQQGTYRVLRGGCWKSLKEDLRCAHRHRNNPGAINSTYGFRCAADVN